MCKPKVKRAVPKIPAKIYYVDGNKFKILASTGKVVKWKDGMNWAIEAIEFFLWTVSYRPVNIKRWYGELLGH